MTTTPDLDPKRVWSAAMTLAITIVQQELNSEALHANLPRAIQNAEERIRRWAGADRHEIAAQLSEEIIAAEPGEFELRAVILHMTRVVDTLNRDRSFKLATMTQAAMQELVHLEDQFADYGYDDWWLTEPNQLDDGWKR